MFRRLHVAAVVCLCLMGSGIATAASTSGQGRASSRNSARASAAKGRKSSPGPLIGTIRREYLDRTLFWTTADLEMKLLDFQRYYNGHRTHAGLDRRTPDPSTNPGCGRANVSSYQWQLHCRGLYQTPMAA
jgi:integrase-like protein